MRLIHFLDFKSNMEKELRRISEFLDLTIQQKKWPDLLKVCNFDSISRLCLEEPHIDSSFWNGGRRSCYGGVSTFSWDKFLTDSHGIELENRVVGVIGKSGNDWLLRH